MENHSENRRHFTRIPMDSEVALRCGEQQWTSRLFDISLKGALLQTPDAFEKQSGTTCQINFSLSETNVEIVMQGEIVHQQGEHLGFRCDSIDLDSISHLKRMVELNLGDESLLERELVELFDAGN